MWQKLVVVNHDCFYTCVVGGAQVERLPRWAEVAGQLVLLANSRRVTGCVIAILLTKELLVPAGSFVFRKVVVN